MTERERVRTAYRAAFGAGFVLLGAIITVRTLVAEAPAGAKITGTSLGLAMCALGIVRMAAWLRARRDAS